MAILNKEGSYFRTHGYMGNSANHWETLFQYQTFWILTWDSSLSMAQYGTTSVWAIESKNNQPACRSAREASWTLAVCTGRTSNSPPDG